MLKSTRALGTRTRLQHQVHIFVLDNFKSCLLVFKACVLDSSTDNHTPQVF